jgi:integrase
MKPNPPADKKKDKGPLEVVSQGNISIPIYATTNRIYRKNPITGKKELKSEHPQFTVSYYDGTKRKLRKFADLADARKEADFIIAKSLNAETEVLKLTGSDRVDHVRAKQKLRELQEHYAKLQKEKAERQKDNVEPQEHHADVNLYTAIDDYVAAMRRLPEEVTLKEIVEFYRKRHPIGAKQKTVREVVDELIKAKIESGKSDVYIKDLRLRLGKFADSFENIRISAVTGEEIEQFIRAPRPRGKTGTTRILSGRTQNNFRQRINTLIEFAIGRGYLAKDYDEMRAVDFAAEDSGEIEVFTPAELRKLFDTCLTPMKERGKLRTREEMIPYLAIAAFCGLRAAEIQRLDWSDVVLKGPEPRVKVTAKKAKTRSRRNVPLSQNCIAWLLPYAKESGPVVDLARADKQLFIYIASKAGVPWKHNALRHSFISYRLADIKSPAKVCYEAGNSEHMIFKHYHQLVSEADAKEWFGIVPPPKEGAEIIPIPLAQRGEPTMVQRTSADIAIAQP